VRTDTLWVGARDAAKHLAVYRIALPAKNDPVISVSGTKLAKPCSGVHCGHGKDPQVTKYMNHWSRHRNSR
jgi:hypothetical protein